MIKEVVNYYHKL